VITVHYIPKDPIHLPAPVVTRADQNRQAFYAWMDKNQIDPLLAIAIPEQSNKIIQEFEILDTPSDLPVLRWRLHRERNQSDLVLVEPVDDGLIYHVPAELITGTLAWRLEAHADHILRMLTHR